jgi:hypothetical protein
MSSEQPITQSMRERAIYERVIKLKAIAAQQTREHVVSMASHVINVLTGKDEDTETIDSSNPLGLAPSAPEVIPRLHWKNPVMEVIKSELGDESQWGGATVGSLGEYFSDTYTDERPSAIFNAGFYSGVLAVKLGLVNPEDFGIDPESVVATAELDGLSNGAAPETTEPDSL